MYADDGLTGFDLIAILEIDHCYRFAVDESLVRAAHVHEPAMGRIDLDHEVNARKELVLDGQAEMGALGSSDDEIVVFLEAKGLACVGTFRYFQSDTHNTSRFRRMAD